jgi:TatD DNase family protein
MMLVDHHCHIDRPEFANDLEDVVARAHSAGVGLMVNISTRVRKFEHLISVVERFDTVYGTVGTHPHYAHEELDVTTEDLARLAEHRKIVGLGEAGLDYFYKHSTPEAQAQGFRVHIAAARMTGLPLEIHTRDADADTIAILEEEHAKGPFPAILHCFTGGRELAMRAVELGLYVSFSGVVSFKKNDVLRAIANEVPLDRVLVETDAPYLAPEPYRGKQNEPAYVVHTARALANARGLTLEDFAAATTENFFRIYTKIPRPGAAA